MPKSKRQKREEAEERQEEYNKLTADQKIKRILSRRGKSKKELNRIEKTGA